VTTIIKDSKSCSFVKPVDASTMEELVAGLLSLSDTASQELQSDGIAVSDQKVTYEIDMRFKGQGMTSLLTIPVELDRLKASDGKQWLKTQLEEKHKRAFTFSFDYDHEVVNLRTLVEGKAHGVQLPQIAAGSAVPPANAKLDEQPAFCGGQNVSMKVYDRLLLLAGNRIPGPAIILDMDSTTLIEQGCEATIDKCGMIIIQPGSTAVSKHLINSDPDKITLEVIENALKATRFEMDAVVYRTAMSPGIREQHDQFPVIADPVGKMVMGQFGSFIPAFLRSYKQDVLDGDVILLNDPYSCDGAVSHLNDWLVLTPIDDDSGTRIG
jgi:5-oxoprolinase (ATP-hydrolysing)